MYLQQKGNDALMNLWTTTQVRKWTHCGEVITIKKPEQLLSLEETQRGIDWQQILPAIDRHRPIPFCFAGGFIHAEQEEKTGLRKLILLRSKDGFCGDSGFWHEEEPDYPGMLLKRTATTIRLGSNNELFVPDITFFPERPGWHFIPLDRYRAAIGRAHKDAVARCGIRPTKLVSTPVMWGRYTASWLVFSVVKSSNDISTRWLAIATVEPNSPCLECTGLLVWQKLPCGTRYIDTIQNREVHEINLRTGTDRVWQSGQSRTSTLAEEVGHKPTIASNKVRVVLESIWAPTPGLQPLLDKLGIKTRYQQAHH